MFFISWGYVALTWFEPTHPNDDSLEKWGSTFSNLFTVELIILSLFSIDFLIATYHNYFERRMKDYKFLATHEEYEYESSSPQREYFSPINRSLTKSKTVKQTVRDMRLERKNTMGTSVSNQSSKLPNHRSPFTMMRLLFETMWMESDLMWKLVILSIFVSDFVQFFVLYPDAAYRYSKLFRTGSSHL